MHHKIVCMSNKSPYRIVLKGIIGLFVCNGTIQSNRIFNFLFKASHLTTLVVCLLVFYYMESHYRIQCNSSSK